MLPRIASQREVRRAPHCTRLRGEHLSLFRALARSCIALASPFVKYASYAMSRSIDCKGQESRVRDCAGRTMVESILNIWPVESTTFFRFLFFGLLSSSAQPTSLIPLCLRTPSRTSPVLNCDCSLRPVDICRATRLYEDRRDSYSLEPPARRPFFFIEITNERFNHTRSKVAAPPFFFSSLSFIFSDLLFPFLLSLSNDLSLQEEPFPSSTLALTRMARRRAAAASSRRPALARVSAAALAVAAAALVLGSAFSSSSSSSAVSFFATAQPITYADLLSNLPDSKSPKIDDEKPSAAAAKPAAPTSSNNKFASGDELVPKARAAAAGSETAAATNTAARSDGNAGAAASRAGTSAAGDLAAKRDAGGQDKLAPIGGAASAAAAAAPSAPAPAPSAPTPPPPPPPSDPKSLALAAATAAARGEVKPTAAPAQAGPSLGAVSAGGGPGVAAAGTLVGAAAAREAPAAASSAGNLPAAGAGAAAAGPAGGRVALPNGMTVLTKADADALLSLRDAIANWDELVGWGLKGWSPNSNPCAGWTGVSCSNAKRVIGVDLSGWMVKGTLPAELALLDELRTFNASDCDLTGGLPIGWAANGAFARLSVLDLSNNARLAAEIPGEWGDAKAFPSLTVLALRNVGLAAPLNDAWPASRAAMAKLATLDLSGNAIRGVLPAAFGSGGTLTKLRTLLLNNNSIAGTLPKEWGSDNDTLASLSVLDLSRNVLEGRLPKSWGSNGGFSQLTELHLQVNRLAGSLPVEWGQSGRFPRLGWLDVYGNRLAGPVPDTWGRRGGGVSRLTTLSLRPGNAKLCAKVPLQLRNAAVGERAAPLGPAPLGACPTPVPRPEPIEAPPADAVSPVDDPAELDEAIAGSPAGAPLPLRKPRKKAAPVVPAAPLVDPDFDEWFFPEDEGDAGGAAGVVKAPSSADDASSLVAGAPSAPAQMQRIKVGDFDIVVPALGSAEKPLFKPPPEAFAAAPAPAAPKAADREPVSSHGKRKRSAAGGAPAPSPAGPPAPPPLPIMTPVKVAFVEATFNLTGLNLDVANATLRRGAERAMRRALGGGSGGGGEEGNGGGAGNGPNVTLLALRDVLPDGTVDVSTALPPLPDQGSLADVDPALAAADKALKAKARADKEAESVGFRRRLSFASSSRRSLAQATTAADDVAAPARSASTRGKAESRTPSSGPPPARQGSKTRSLRRRRLPRRPPRARQEGTLLLPPATTPYPPL